MSDAYVITTYNGRAVPAEYRNLIFSKWLRSLRYGNDLLKMVDPKAYYSYHNALIDDLLGRPDTHVRIAALEDDADVVLGFCVHRPDRPTPVVDYVYVNRDMRKQGIAAALCPSYEMAQFSHVTKTALVVIGKKLQGWVYNPYV